MHTFEQGSYSFTIFTPTYNRAKLLPRVWDSLKCQTMQNLEWLIVDDGSTDNTAELVKTWQTEHRLPIHYFHQENQGIHRSFNRGVSLAQGTFFARLDSDDYLVPNALERLLFHWEAIPESARSGFSGVSVLCMDQHGHTIGRPFPRDILDCHCFETYRSPGERWGFHRTAVLKDFLYPEIEGEKWSADSLVWNRIGLHYRIRHVNERLKIRVVHTGMEGSNVDRIRARSPRGARLYYQEYMSLPLPLRHKWRQTLNYVRFSFHAGLSASEMIGDTASRWSTVLCLLPGYLVYQRDLKSL